MSAPVTLRLLLSYYYFKHLDLDEWLAEHAETEGATLDVFADSGGYSAHTRGATIEVDDYAAWVNRWAHRLNVVATLDVIGDAVATARNTERLRELVAVPVIPAFHVNEPWDALEQLLADGERYIALGGMVGKPPRALLGWATHAFRLAGDAAVYHGFGLTHPAAVRSLPWYSVDSSSWSGGFMRGGVTLHDRDRVVTTRVVTAHSARSHSGARTIWPSATRPEVTTLLRSRGIDPTVLLDPEHFAPRDAPEWVPGRNSVHFEHHPLMSVIVDDLLRWERDLRARWGEIRVPDQPKMPPGLRMFMASSVSPGFVTRSPAFFDHPEYPGPSPLTRYAPAQPQPTGG